MRLAGSSSQRGLSYRVSAFALIHLLYLSPSRASQMAHQFFAKSPARSSNQPVSPPPARQAQPPIHPVPPQPPRSAAVSPRPTANAVSQAPFTPYPGDLSASYATPHPHITVETIRTAHIPSLTRITGLLLPIRYPNSFYTNTITDPIVASLSRVAIYHDHPVAAAPNSSASSGSDKVIGGIRCRLERQYPDREVQGRRVATNLYIQTLHLLSPYRGHGVAASLLNSLICASPSDAKGKSRVSEIVKHYNIRSVTAHVHEANEDGLRWYVARGFKVQEGVVEGYYRKLRPSGAKVVRLDVQWEEEADGQSPVSEKKNASQSTVRSDPDDEEWEKVEAEDDEEDDHGVQLLGESRVLDKEEMTPSRKRKAEEESGSKSQRR